MVNVKKKAGLYWTAFLKFFAELVPVMLWFVRTIYGNTNIISLFRRKRCKFCSELIEMQSCNFLVKFLAQAGNSYFTITVVTDIYLSNCLVSETV